MEHIQSIQRPILSSELNRMVSKGLHRTPPDQTPIISKILVPLYEREKENGLVNATAEFILSVSSKALTNAESKAFNFLINIENSSDSATTRESSAAGIFGISEAAFKRTRRYRIIDKVAEHMSKLHTWINYSHENQEKNGDGVHLDRKRRLSRDVLDNIRNGSVKAYDFLLENPHRLRRKYVYDIDIDMMDVGTSDTAKVSTTYASSRYLPLKKPLSIYICRTYEDMMTVIQDESLVGLEVAELGVDSWQDNLKQMSASMWLNEDLCKRKQVINNGKYLKFEFETPETGNESSINVNISTTYFIGSNVRRYPVKLINHFAIDGVDIRFVIRVPSALLRSLNYSDYFSGFDGKLPFGKQQVSEKRIDLSADRFERYVHVDKELLIWPGAGIEFMWELED